MFRNLFLSLAALGCLALSAVAADVVLKTPGEIDWKVSGTLPQGAATHDYHLIYEEPKTHGIQTFVRFSKGYELSAHQHTHDETIVVLKGKLAVTTGGKTTTLGPGSYAVLPAGTAHALKVQGWASCEMLITFAGPMDLKPAANP
jgi:quercetin dioxygenase-like cupin family protein